ncbi:DUF6702 family protein [Pedobacter sp.]
MNALLSKLLLFVSVPIIFLGKASGYKHPFHVSTTEIAYNTKSKSLEITCRIFTDDFETILNQRFKKKIDLSAKNQAKEMNALVKSYVNTNLKFAVDGKSFEPNYIGFENDHEATNIYLEIENIAAFKKLAVSNGILYDLFDDQMNILHVEKNGARKSTKVNFPEKQMIINF